MLDDLKFVMGSVAKKDFLPALTHFVISGGRVRGYNGKLALSSPLDVGIECKPRADLLVRAIAQCTETIQMSLTKAGKLTVKSGSFKAFVECVEGETPHILPSGDMLEVNAEGLYAAFDELAHIVGNDASRPWTNGMLIREGSVFVTNNVIVIQKWIGVTLPSMNIPLDAIKEILRCKEVFTHIQYDGSTATFHYASGRWICTQLLSSDWPDFATILDKESCPVPIDEKLFRALDQLGPFVDKLGRVYFAEGCLRTHEEEGVGAVAALDGFSYEGAYALEMLRKIETVADIIDWSLYPRPCLFFKGETLRGAIVGVHK